MEPVLGGLPVFSGHPVFPCGWPLNTVSTVSLQLSLERIVFGKIHYLSKKTVVLKHALNIVCLPNNKFQIVIIFTAKTQWSIITLIS